MRRSALFLSAAALALSACGGADPAATEERVATARAGTGNVDLSITDASVRLNANPAAPSAAYFTVRGGEVAATITGVQSADVERAELHESRMQGGVMSMDAVSDVDVPANAEVRFRQGGLHVMLFGLSDAARAAGKLTLSISFADGTSQSIEAPLVSVTGEPVVARAAPAAALPKAAPRRIATPAIETPAVAPNVEPEAPDEHAGH